VTHPTHSRGKVPYLRPPQRKIILILHPFQGKMLNIPHPYQEKNPPYYTPAPGKMLPILHPSQKKILPYSSVLLREKSSLSPSISGENALFFPPNSGKKCSLLLHPPQG
jgi:hypothetical protein